MNTSEKRFFLLHTFETPFVSNSLDRIHGHVSLFHSSYSFYKKHRHRKSFARWTSLYERIAGEDSNRRGEERFVSRQPDFLSSIFQRLLHRLAARKKQVPGTTKEFSAPGVAWIEVDSSTGEKLRVVSCSRGEGDRRERTSFPPYLKPPSVRRRASPSIMRK